jgi:hypothetical protein
VEKSLDAIIIAAILLKIYMVIVYAQNAVKVILVFAGRECYSTKNGGKGGTYNE